MPDLLAGLLLADVPDDREVMAVDHLAAKRPSYSEHGRGDAVQGDNRG